MRFRRIFVLRRVPSSNENLCASPLENQVRIFVRITDASGNEIQLAKPIRVNDTGRGSYVLRYTPLRALRRQRFREEKRVERAYRFARKIAIFDARERCWSIERCIATNRGIFNIGQDDLREKKQHKKSLLNSGAGAIAAG